LGCIESGFGSFLGRVLTFPKSRDWIWKMIKKLKLYCVWVGRSRGIFKDWETCLPLVDKHQGAKYRRVDGTLVEVLKAFKERLEQL